MTDPVVAIVAGTYNRLDQVRRLIESVRRETKAPHVLYVTDAGSTDGTIDYLRSVASNVVRPIFVGRRVGQARAYNDVFLAVNAPYVCWLSDDNEIVNGGLDTALRILRSDGRIGMVGLKVRDMVGPFAEASYIGGISTIGILNVNQGMLPSKLLQTLGGFSEEFRDYGIDPDLTAKVLFSGWDIVYTRDVAIHHYRNWSMDKDSDEYKSLKQKHDRAQELYRQHYGEASPAQLKWRKRAWSWARAQLGKRHDLSLNGKTPIFGNLPRDYYNALHARYINPLDPLLTLGKAYHLRQRASARIGPQAPR